MNRLRLCPVAFRAVANLGMSVANAFTSITLVSRYPARDSHNHTTGSVNRLASTRSSQPP
jgi:hypothetical protein